MLKLVFCNQTKPAGRLRRPVFGVLARRASRLFPGQTAGKTVSLVLVGERESWRLNKLYRHKNRPTNVLSFAGQVPGELGDIIICPAVARREAALNGTSLAERLAELFAHGLLHLLGCDHASAAAEKKMERLAVKILNEKTL